MDENKTLEEIYYKADGYLANPVKIFEICKAKKLNERNFVVLTNGLVSKGKLRKVDFGIVSITDSGITDVESRLDDSLTAKRKLERTNFLQELYKISNGDVNTKLDFKEIGFSIGLDADRSSYVIELLNQRGLISNESGSISLTEEGVRSLQS